MADSAAPPIARLAQPKRFGEPGEFLGRKAKEAEDRTSAPGRSTGAMPIGIAQGFAGGMQYPPNQLLNPFAWAQFIKALKAGKLKIK